MKLVELNVLKNITHLNKQKNVKNVFQIVLNVKNMNIALNVKKVILYLLRTTNVRLMLKRIQKQYKNKKINYLQFPLAMFQMKLKSIKYNSII